MKVKEILEMVENHEISVDEAAILIDNPIGYILTIGFTLFLYGIARIPVNVVREHRKSFMDLVKRKNRLLVL